VALVLYQLPPAWGRLPSLSHFCVKLETYLRMVGLPYRTEIGLPAQGPKGKVPWIDDGGTSIGDSSRIIEHLEAKSSAPLDAPLSPLDRARGLALERMVEEHTYFAVLWLRWTGSASWPFMREYLEALIPPELKAGELVERARSGILESIRAQGVGRHTRDEIVDLAVRDLSALSTLLDDRPYFLGEDPTTYDCSLYGVLAQVLWPPWEAEDRAHLESLPNLVAFCERIRDRYWSGWKPGV
jgi:glutathione S-transferase